MKTSATNKKIRELITGIRDKSLIPRPEFQRRFVWRNDDKINFIQTVLMGYPFPEIYVADGDVDLETGVGTQVLVDGQQRITTLYQYFTSSNLLKLRGKTPAYQQLSTEQQRAFLNYDVATRDLGSIPRSEIIEVFRRINMTSYSLNDMEINNAVYEGALKKFAESIASLEFFERHRIFTASDLRRMGDVRYVLTLVVTMIGGYFNRDESLSEYLEDFDETFEKEGEIRERIQKALSYLSKCDFSDNSRIWKKVDFFTAFVELDRFRPYDKKLDPGSFKNTLESFYAQVERQATEDSAEYYGAVIQASNDRMNRIKRGKAIANVLEMALKETTLNFRAPN